MPINIVKGDITKFSGDAIVNAANTTLLGGGGVDGAIHNAAGSELLAECRKLNGCDTGKAKITKAYNLPCKFAIHTPGPIWRGGNKDEPQLLKNSYYNSLLLAQEYGCETVAFPSISTGVYRFPLQLASRIALHTILEFLNCSNTVKEVTMMCFDDKTYKTYKDNLQRMSLN